MASPSRPEFGDLLTSTVSSPTHLFGLGYPVREGTHTDEIGSFVFSPDRPLCLILTGVGNEIGYGCAPGTWRPYEEER